MKISLLYLAIIIFYSYLFPICAEFKEANVEAKFLTSIRNNPEECYKTATGHKNSSYAHAAMGILINGSKDNGGNVELAVKALGRYAGKSEEHFGKACLMVAQSSLAQQIIDKLHSSHYSNAKLVASICATQALGEYLVKEKENSYILGEEGEALKMKPASSSSKIPLALFEPNDTEVNRLAVTAAAYQKNNEVKDKVLALIGKDQDLNASIILYMALNSITPEKELIENAYKRTKNSVKAITKPSRLLSTGNPLVPAHAQLIEALGIIGGTDYVNLVNEALKHKDIRVQIEAIKAAGEIKSEEFIKNINYMITRASWPTMVYLCQSMAKFPHMGYVDSLSYRLKNENGRLRQNIMWLLCVIAGKNIGIHKDQVREYWDKNENFSIDKDVSADFFTNNPIRTFSISPYITTFYSVEIYSDRFVYVVDTSKSMSGSKIESLVENLKYSVHEIKSHGYYNLIDFGGDINTMYPKSLTSGKNQALDTIDYFKLTLATRTFDSLHRAYNLDLMDEIVFLSDGAPTGYEMKKWQSIQQSLLVVNRYRPVKISMIEFDAGKSALEGMTITSHQNDGVCEEVFIDMGDEEDKKNNKAKKKGKNKK